MNRTNSDEQQQDQPANKKQKTNIVIDPLICPYCKKIYKINAFLENHVRNKHRNEVPPTFKEHVLQQLVLQQGQISGIRIDNRFMRSLTKARIAELNDAKLNHQKIRKVVLSGLAVRQFILPSKKPNKFNCDCVQLLGFLQHHVPDITTIKTEVISNNKIIVRLETPQMAYIVKETFETLENNNDIRVDFCVTVGTQVRQKILMALVDHFVLNDLEAHLEPHHHHQPKINVRIPGQKHFEKYSFADAMDVFQSTFESEDLIDQSIRDLAEKMPPGTNVEDIFVVL